MAPGKGFTRGAFAMLSGSHFVLARTNYWMSTNERDEIGEDLPPDYISSVRPGGFYGWPWFYIGNHPDPRHKGKHPELADKVVVPDVLVQAHSASLNLCFYNGDQFPSEYKGDIFAAFHGSWNRMKRTGYKVVRVPLDHSTGKVRGEYEDFVTGFATSRRGRSGAATVGVTVHEGRQSSHERRRERHHLACELRQINQKLAKRELLLAMLRIISLARHENWFCSN